MGPSDLTGDNCEGPIAPALPFEPVGMDKHGMGDAAPFAHKPGASLQRNRWNGLLRVACLRGDVQAFQLAQDRFGEASERRRLELVGDSAHQEITGQPHRWRRPMQPPPLAAQLEDCQLRESRERLCDIDRRFSISANAPCFDAIAANTIIELR